MTDMTPQKKPSFVIPIKKHILQKNWSKTIICGLSSGRNNLPQPIWVHSLQLDDRHRNQNMNIREIIWLGNQLESLRLFQFNIIACRLLNLRLVYQIRNKRTLVLEMTTIILCHLAPHRQRGNHILSWCHLQSRRRIVLGAERVEKNEFVTHWVAKSLNRLPKSY